MYRRSLYTFHRRTVPPPAMAAFDQPGREVCAVRRSRTNTPLQALVVMNDPTYLEAARMIATRATAASADPTGRVEAMFRAVLARRPSEAERRLLLGALESQRRRFGGDRDAASSFLAVGESPVAPTGEAAELAAYAAIASLILNLDEALTKE